MIFLFTSEKCTWCDVVKRMLEEELGDFIPPSEIYEVDIERYQHIAEAYNILVVPTLVAGGQSLSGLPTESDLRSFLIQSIPGLDRTESEESRKKVLSKMQKMMKDQKTTPDHSIIATHRS